MEHMQPPSQIGETQISGPQLVSFLRHRLDIKRNNSTKIVYNRKIKYTPIFLKEYNLSTNAVALLVYYLNIKG